MGEIIVVIIILAVLFWLLKKTWHIVRKIFSALPTVIYYIFSWNTILCSKLFYGITKLLHIQSFMYYILSFCSLPSLIYLFKIHIPYSKMERFINVKEYFSKKKKQRNNVIAMSCFYTLTGLAFVLMQFLINDEDDMTSIIVGGLYVIVAFIYTFRRISEWEKENKEFYAKCIEWRKWALKEVDSISEDELEEKVIALTNGIAANDKNKTIFKADEIPYGRAIAFISYFQKNLDYENPIYFSPKMSSDDELREYGILVTTKGIYISKQGEDDIEIPFEGLYEIRNDEEGWHLDYGLSFGEPKTVAVNNEPASIKFNLIVDMLGQMKEVSLASFQGKVRTDLDEAFESIEKAQNNFDIKQRTANASNIIDEAALGTALERNDDVYFTVKNNFDGNQGHGTAAEYANTAIDRIRNPFNRAEHLGSDNAKHGADRRVNGINIQTKYLKTASESIAAAFKDGKAIYLNDDGTMMQIEVPRDQYSKAIELMKKRIANGQVPGETNPENAKNYVRRGHVNYLQAYNIAGSGSIESVTIDAVQGIICAIPGAGITTVLTFATAVWNGAEIEEAAKASAVAGLKVIGKGAVSFTVTMQLSRGKVVNPFYSALKKKGINNANRYTTNYVAKGANTVAKKISTSSLAKSKAGKAIGLDKITGKKVVGGTVTAVIVYGPDVCKAFQGKISGKQLIKNSTVNTAGLVGAALGTAIPIPIVGSMVGGAVGGFVAQKIMNTFVEDDAVTMFRIMREEFLDIVMLFSFNKTEFEEIVADTIGNSEMPKVLQNMYQSGTPKDYADALINAKVREVLSKRKKITQDDIEQGMRLLLEDATVA